MNAPVSLHPAEEMLRDYALGRLDDAAGDSVLQHIEQCDECRRKVGELTNDRFLDQLRDVQGSMDPNATPPTRHVTGGFAPPPPFIAADLIQHPDYDVIRELGRGGMGVVYLARNKMMGRLEVLKVVGRQLVARPRVLDRFLREIRAAAKLQHPNIVAAYTATKLADGLVLSMEYVEGQDLAALVKEKGPLPIANAAFFIYQVAMGLQHAHEKGMVHRDIKPANLILARDGKKAIVKVLDFGLAKVTSEGAIDGDLTSEGQMLGTPDYIAPEQTVDAKKADIRADIYSLGCTLYYLLSGGPPFKGNSLYDLLQAHHSMDAMPLNLKRPEIPAELAALVAKMMAKGPDQRFQTPLAVGQALLPFFKPGSEQKSPSISGKAGVAPKPAPAQTTATERSTSGRSFAPRKVDSGWTKLDESGVATALSIPKKSASKPRRPWKRPPRRLMTGVGGGLLLIGVLFATVAGIFRMKTADGTIVIEGLPNDAVVELDGAKIKVTPRPDGKSFAVMAVPGKHQVCIFRGDEELMSEDVTLTSGGSTPIRVRIETPAPGKGGEPAELPPKGTAAEVPEPARTKAESIFGEARTPNDGDWRVEGNELVQTSLNAATSLTLLVNPVGEYDVTYQVKIDHGWGGIWTLFHAQAAAPTFQYFEVGPPGRTRTKVAFFNEGRWGMIPNMASDFAPRHGVWHDVHITVRGAEYVCRIDGQVLVQGRNDFYTSGHMGIGTTGTASRFRNIRVTAPDGAVLWKGIPLLPGMQAP